MTEPYTPSEARVCIDFCKAAMKRRQPDGSFMDMEDADAAFSRFIAQVRAEALRDAHADFQAYTDAGAPLGYRPIEDFLLARADRIERKEQ